MVSSSAAAPGGGPVSRVIVEPSSGIRGELTVPGDKSVSHRAVIFGSIAEGITRVSGFLFGEDNIRTMDAFRAMGVDIDADGASLTVKGVGLDGLMEPDDVIDAGNSGTTARLLMGLLAGQTFFSVITGDRSLRERPMGRVIRPLTAMGGAMAGRVENTLLPLAIMGRRLSGVEYSSPLASAQVKSAVLLAGLYADGDTTYTEPVKTRDHTERMLKAFGAPVSIDGNMVRISGRPTLAGTELVVPGDISSAAFFIVAALITPGSEILIRGVGINPTRTKIIDLLVRMGADIALLNRTTALPEPVADLRVRSSKLHGIDIGGEEMAGAIDEFPILCIAAAVADGKTTVTGASELRVKESDRIKAMAEGLTTLGVSVEERPDGVTIEGRQRLGGGSVKSYGDHRVAMSMIVAGLVSDGRIEVEDVSCIDISFPGFMDALKEVA